MEHPLPQYHLFERFGIEIEYMIVDRTTLAIAPVADQVIHAASGGYNNAVDRKTLAWSNGMVNHVIVFKTNGPAISLEGLDTAFIQSVREVNKLLEEDGACLLGTGMHPFMNPRSETKLWRHGRQIVYSTYDRIFSCNRHGWSNVQSMHINLPYANDTEFGRLLAAVRLVLPLIPALSASSPLMENRFSGFYDTRLEVKRSNSMLVPSINADVIPEPVFTTDEYRHKILEPIYRELAPHDPEGILCEEWINGRGAIARLERGTIEIRSIDTQETPAADLAVAAAIVAAVKLCAAECFCPLDAQKSWSVDRLWDIMLDTVKNGERATISDRDYLAALGYAAGPCTAGDLWRHLVAACIERDLVWIAPYRDILERMLVRGTLAAAIAGQVGPKASWKTIDEVYRKLCDCLQSGTLL
jgi:hypothetical protein